MTRTSLSLWILSALAVGAMTGMGRAQESGSPQSGTEIIAPGIRKLTITGQYRLRYENRFNYDFDDNAGANNDFFGQRTRLNIGAEFNDRMSAFLQLQDVRNWGEEKSTTDDDAQGLDFHQGWLLVKDTPWVGGDTKLGRQVISLGAQRLIGGLDWANQGRAFDGILNTRKLEGDHTVQTFFLDAGETLNNINDDVYVVGGYGVFDAGEKVTVDGYLIWLHDDGAAAGLVHNRITLGARYVQEVTDQLDIEVELASQTGDQAGADIPFGETYALHAHGRYTFEGEQALFVQGEVNLASGDDPTTADNERFNNLFPTGHMHWGMIDFASWSNLVHGMIQVGGKVDDQTKWYGAFHVFRAAEETDVFGGPNGTLSTGGAGFSKDMGNEIDLWLHHDLGTERVKSSIQVGYRLFLPGDGVRDSMGSDNPAHFVYVMADFVF